MANSINTRSARRIEASISPEELRHRYLYDPATGDLFHRYLPEAGVRRNTRCSGKIATTLSARGYLDVNLGRGRVRAHRIIWAMHYGEWPPLFVDHRNGNRSDNRIGNLRHASKSENGRNRGAQRNNLVGLKGVSRLPSGRWRASILYAGIKHHLAVRDTPEAASAIYEAVARELFGQFYCPPQRLIALPLDMTELEAADLYDDTAPMTPEEMRRDFMFDAFCHHQHEARI